jgi:hypothetical protein
MGFSPGLGLPYDASSRPTPRALDAREQDSISRICRKLREGDAVKFLNEMRFEDVDDEG